MVRVADGEIVAFIGRYIEEHGYCPSMRDVMGGVGLSSVGAMRYRMDRLREKGLVKFDNKVPRSIRLA